MLIEPVLRAQAQACDSVNLMLRCRAQSISMDERQVSVVVNRTVTGKTFGLTAHSMADCIGRIKVLAHVDDDSNDAAIARQALGAAPARHVRNEFNIPGLQLGLRCEGSPIVAVEPCIAPADQPNHYQPSARPGGCAWSPMASQKSCSI